MSATETFTAIRTAIQPPAPQHRRRPAWPSWWPLGLVLAVQAVLSVSLVGRDSAFADEALYLWAGRLQWAHWLHGTSMPNVASYFSGSPVLYPPVGAIAGAVGGLAGARVLSLLFMLGATVLLYATAKRLFGPVPALCGAALWVTTEAAVSLGVFAVYDPMAVFLCCAAVWAAVEAGYRHRHAELVAASAVLLALGGLTAYSYAIYVPVVVAVAVMAWWPRLGRRQALISGAWLGGGALVLLTGGATMMKLWPGIMLTTLNRSAGTNTVLYVVNEAWYLTGLVVVLAAIGVVLCWTGERDRLKTGLLAALCCAALVVPAEQARILAATSQEKHVAVGAWLAAMGAGYAVSRLVRFPQAGTRATAAVAGLALAFPLYTGWTQASAKLGYWPQTISFSHRFAQLAAGTRGKLLVEWDDYALYYTPEGGQWQRWASLFPNPSVNAGLRAYLNGEIAQIHARQVALVALYFPSPSINVTAAQVRAGSVRLTASLTPGIRMIESALAADRAYRLAAIVPAGNSENTPGAYVIWKLTK